MDMTDREAEPQFSRPLRQVFLMLVSIGLFAIGAYLAYPKVAPVFLANPYLNGVILFVFVIGVLACFLQVVQLIVSVQWIEGFAAQRPGHEITKAPRLLAPLAALLRKRGKRMQIGAASSRSILESVGTRIEEARDITRYIVNLLIFLGLLGTFYGLATTVPAVVETIRSLAPQEGEGGVEVFSRLMTGLEAQLGGMGTAFASSLLGLAGSLVVGLLELFAGHGQNRFYQELEEWLSTITRLGFSSGEGEGETEATAEAGFLGATLDQLAEQMEALHALFARSDESRAALEGRVGALADAVQTLGTAMESQLGDSQALTAALDRVAQGQARATAAIEARMGEEGSMADAEARMRLRSIDVQLLRILEEMSAGRQETVTDLRGDLAELVRVLSRLAPGDERWG
ncbi:MAG: biopolymer transporter ExbB [Rhodobacteraceae bacterium]|nr:biopolymer transporter ExbB [Paracoccaceae bacterium]